MSKATAPDRDSSLADLIGPRVIVSLTGPAALMCVGDRTTKIQHADIVK